MFKVINYIIVTDMEGNIRIYRLPMGRGMDQWKWYCPSQRRGQYYFMVCTTTRGQSVLRDYYMTFSISALVLARDSHIKPDSEAGGLIWVEGWYQGRYGKFHVSLFITYFTLTFSKHWLLCCKKDLWTDKLRK